MWDGVISIAIRRNNQVPLAVLALLERILCLLPVIEVSEEEDTLRGWRPFSTVDGAVRHGMDAELLVAFCELVQASFILLDVPKDRAEAAISTVDLSLVKVQITIQLEQLLNFRCTVLHGLVVPFPFLLALAVIHSCFAEVAT